MIWALALLVVGASAQATNCDVSSFTKMAQRRRECKKRDSCKWFVGDKSCATGTSCASLNANKCKKRNDCYTNWTASGRPCQDYDPNVAVPCSQLGGKKNSAKCKAQPACTIGGGEKQAKQCLDIPADLQSRVCSTLNGSVNKYLCRAALHCDYQTQGELCVKRPSTAACSGENNEVDCLANKNGCSWDGSSCDAQPCRDITTANHGRFARQKCNSSSRGCVWYQGFHAGDFDPTGKKEDQRNAQASDKKAEGTCQNGIDNCNDIHVENYCKLAATKYNINGCYWNPEATHMLKPRCSTTQPCDDHKSENACQLADSMKGGGAKCVWQMSGDTERCMEYDCTDAELDTKNKCNTVGCHWHRNKNKRDPTQVGYCGVYDKSLGRRRFM